MRVRDEGRSNAAHWYSEAQRLAEENMRLREALARASEWGGLGRNYDSGVRFHLFQWIENGMHGPLPKMPRHLTPPNVGAKLETTAPAEN